MLEMYLRCKWGWSTGILETFHLYCQPRLWYLLLIDWKRNCTYLLFHHFIISWLLADFPDLGTAPKGDAGPKWRQSTVVWLTGLQCWEMRNNRVKGSGQQKGDGNRRDFFWCHKCWSRSLYWVQGEVPPLSAGSIPSTDSDLFLGSVCSSLSNFVHFPTKHYLFKNSHPVLFMFLCNS